MRDIRFGTDGWRALLDSVFTDLNVTRVAEAFVRHLHSTGDAGSSVAIAYDGRRRSKHFASLFAEILSAHGHPVILASSIVPTPVLSFAVRHHGCSAGVMITASHNPPDYNGIKFKGAYGGPFMSDRTRDVEAELRATTEGKRDPALVRTVDLLPAYLAHLGTVVDMQALREFARTDSARASVMIDSMGGAGGTLLEEILAPLGWRAQTIFGTPDERFYDRLPEPIAQNLGPLLYNTAVTDALLGIATDGDADRCSIVYEDGTWMTAQENILALVWHLQVNKGWNGAVIKSASVTDKVRMLAQRRGAEVFDVSVGFKYITEVMLKEDFLFGGEESGGFGFKHHLPERDGILTGLLFCEMIAVTGRTLKEIMREVYDVVGEVHYDRIDAPYDRPDRADILPRLAAMTGGETLGGFAVQSVRTYREGTALTGVKFLLGNARWLLVRTSQTEPLVRIYAEGQKDDEVRMLLAEGKRLAGL